MQLREVGPFEVFPIGMGCAGLSVAPGDEDGKEQIEVASQVVRIDSVQNSFNPADRNSADVIDYCERSRIAFLAYSPLGRLGEKARQLAAATVPLSEEEVAFLNG